MKEKSEAKEESSADEARHPKRQEEKFSYTPPLQSGEIPLQSGEIPTTAGGNFPLKWATGTQETPTGRARNFGVSCLYRNSTIVPEDAEGTPNLQWKGLFNQENRITPDWPSQWNVCGYLLLGRNSD